MCVSRATGQPSAPPQTLAMGLSAPPQPVQNDMVTQCEGALCNAAVKVSGKTLAAEPHKRAPSNPLACSAAQRAACQPCPWRACTREAKKRLARTRVLSARPVPAPASCPTQAAARTTRPRPRHQRLRECPRRASRHLAADARPCLPKEGDTLHRAQVQPHSMVYREMSSSRCCFESSSSRAASSSSRAAARWSTML